MLLGKQQLGATSCRFFQSGIKLQGNPCGYAEYAYRALLYWDNAANAAATCTRRSSFEVFFSLY
ncbi:hypothetical protein HDV63DRAFT_386291 [Trichoderma sp. SZMC 28014]